jgi:hypothetical protein
VSLVILMLLGLQAFSQVPPRHIEDLDRSGFLARPTGEPPEMTAVAGPRYLDLVPDSKREICRIILVHQARSNRGLYRLRIVNAIGEEIWKCTL